MSFPSPTKRITRRKPAQRGFTLMELMIVVALIAIVTALAAPAIGAARADSRTHEVAVDIVRMLRNARSSAAAYGRAHLVVFDTTGDGSINVYRGINNRCNTNDWVTYQAGGRAGSPMWVDGVHSGQHAMGSSTYRLTAPLGGALQICFEPTGITRWRRLAVGRFSESNSDASGSIDGAFIFSVQRRSNGNPIGVTRRVIMPRGSDARILR